eukprot:8112904-Lingulodinium_polyedra.AAC.1
MDLRWAGVVRGRSVDAAAGSDSDTKSNNESCSLASSPAGLAEKKEKFLAGVFVKRGAALVRPNHSVYGLAERPEVETM